MKKIIIILSILLGLQAQAQIAPCDSISYTTTSTINYPLIVSGNVSGLSNMADTIIWSWSICNSTMCYSGVGANASFGQVSLTDTLKVCYDVYIDIGGITYACTGCDTLIYNPNTYQWESKMSNPTSITNLPLTTIIDNKIYDLLGRELTSIPIGKMYIRNKRLCIRK